MKLEFRNFLKYGFTDDDFDNFLFICPKCNKGILKRNKDKEINQETAEKLRLLKAKNYEVIEQLEDRFSLILTCGHCSESVIISGVSYPSEKYYYDDYPRFGDYTGNEYCEDITNYNPQFIYPPISLIDLPDYYPYQIKEELDRVFLLYWVDKAACVNAIRVFIEKVLDELNIEKEEKNKKGKIKKIDLHTRIEIYLSKKYPEVAELLLAIKYIGNEGSHVSKIETFDLIDTLEILEHCLIELYDKKTKSIEEKAQLLQKKYQ